MCQEFGELFFRTGDHAQAHFAGRAYVLPEDLQSVFVPAAAHRLTHSRLGARGGEEIALEILRTVPV